MKKRYFILTLFFTAGIGIFFATNKKQTTGIRPLIIAFDAKINSADPRLIGSDAGSQYVEELRFLPLVSFDKNGNWTQILADTIDLQNNDVIVTLKKGLHFANGQEIISADVQATYNAILNPAEGLPPSPRKGAFSSIDSIKVLDPYKVTFTLKKADASFINNLTIGILPKDAVQNEPIGNMIGKNYESGPFLLTKITESDWEFSANKSFDYAAPAKLETFIIKIIPDSSTRYAALIKGDIDLIQNSLDPDKVYVIENDHAKDFQILKSTKLATTYIGFNFKDPLLKNKDVRKALAYGLDRESILKYRLRSNESPATGLFPDNSFYFDPNLPLIPFQKETSVKYLKDSDLALPVELKLSVSSSNKTNIEIAKTMAVTLEDAGFNVSVETLENSVFLQHLNLGLVQMWIAPWVGFKDPDHLRFIFGSDMAPPYGANRGHYSNPDLDVLLEQGRAELDRTKRKEIYSKAQELIANDMPYIYLWHGINVAVMSNRVHGFELYSDGRYWSLSNTTVDAQ